MSPHSPLRTPGAVSLHIRPPLSPPPAALEQISLLQKLPVASPEDSTVRKWALRTEHTVPGASSSGRVRASLPFNHNRVLRAIADLDGWEGWIGDDWRMNSMYEVPDPLFATPPISDDTRFSKIIREPFSRQGPVLLDVSAGTLILRASVANNQRIGSRGIQGMRWMQVLFRDSRTVAAQIPTTCLRVPVALQSPNATLQSVKSGDESKLRRFVGKWLPSLAATSYNQPAFYFLRSDILPSAPSISVLILKPHDVPRPAMPLQRRRNHPSFFFTAITRQFNIFSNSSRLYCQCPTRCSFTPRSKMCF
ncbi:hypothetical protein C8J57DRAFT_1718469 [Mycena rebaudengoi]|nr:hypothetical protein C8J57DRAFT_1718469 [Mycena rebaudengoi]